MEATIDIPEPVYRELESRAALEGKEIEALILQFVAMSLQVKKAGQTPPRQGWAPVIESKNPGSLRLGEEGVYEYIPFP